MGEIFIDYLLFLQNLRLQLNGIFDSFFLLMTSMAESPAPFLFLAWIYWCIDKNAGIRMALNTGIGCAANQVIKGIVKIDRPWVRDERIQPVKGALASARGYSFPSGHTARAGAAYAVYSLELFRNKSKKAGTVFLAIFLLIAFSRNWLGVHTPEDVLVSIVLCLLIWLILNRTLAWVEKGRNRDIIFCITACFLSILPMFWLGSLSNIGSCLGFFTGWLIERRFINFSIQSSTAKKMERGAIGALGIVFISTVLPRSLSQIITDKHAAFISAFFLAFFIMAIWPAVFSLERNKKRTAFLLLCCLILILPFGISLAKAEDKTEIKAEEKTIAVIGHRGFAAAAPENTIPSFEAAIRQKVDYIELDVQLSKDRIIVVCHDDNLQRLTGRDIQLNTLTQEELKKTDVGSWFSSEYAGTGIPTLEEVLDLVKETDIKIYLELKDIGEDPLFPGMVLDLVKEKGMLNQCVFASFQYEYLRQIKAQDAEAKVLLNTTSSEMALPNDYPAEYYGVYIKTFSQELIEAIHEKGSYAFIWTVDEKEQMEEAVKAGVDGICSNSPDIVQAYLESH